MATFIGFNTQKIDQVRKTSFIDSGDGGSGSVTNSIRPTKKFRTVDRDLVVQDLINALNIPQGQKPGKPEYGTTLWSFVFEPNTIDVQVQIENEIRRIAGQDPRLTLNSVVSYPQDNGILVEVEFAISPFNNVEQLAIRFDQNTTQAYSA
jgi:phage baseplate assembly protein W